MSSIQADGTPPLRDVFASASKVLTRAVIESGERAGLRAAVVLGCCLLAGPVVRAQVPVQLSSRDVSGCQRLDLGELRRLLRIELDTEIVDTAAPGALRLRLECHAHQIRIRVQGGIKQVRELSMPSAGDRLRPRILALAIAELLRGSSAVELPESAASSPSRRAPSRRREPATRPEPVVLVADERPPRPWLGLSLVGEMLAFPERPLPHPMSSGGLALRYADPDGPGGSLTFGIAADSTERGGFRRVRTLANLTVSGDWLLLGGPALALRAGLGLRYGLARVHGHVNPDTLDPKTEVTEHMVDGVWGGPFALLRLRGGVLEPLAVMLQVNGGVAHLQLKADAETRGPNGPVLSRVQLGGFGRYWYSVLLGLGIRLR